MLEFIGREGDVQELAALQKVPSASLVVIQGRRRIGKSRLVEEFARGQKFYHFAGLAPGPKITAQSQRDEFAAQLSTQTGLPAIKTHDWNQLFLLLAREVKQGRVIILLDEISWMGSKDPTFLGKLKNAWDIHFNKNPKLMLILCGSVSSWIEKNIISSTAYLGRPSLYMKLDQLPLDACNEFWGKHRDRISAFEKLKILSVTGGVPRYLELINPALSAEANIKRLCFSKNGVLVNEFERIFSDIFGLRSKIYKKIVNHLIKGMASQDDLMKACNKTKTGDFSEYINDLVKAGFVARDYTWHLKTGEISKLSHYRLKDNYLRFYLRYIQPNKPKIEKGEFDGRSISALPAWDTILALQVENLVLHNEKKIINILGIEPEEVIFSNLFFNAKRQRKQVVKLIF